MSEKDPFELDGEENFIPSIFNYCDRWCERCPFTYRCRVYAMENEGPDDPESRDITNAKFWRKLEGIFKQTHEMIAQWAKESGIDLEALDTDSAVEEHRRQIDDAENHKLALAAKSYAESVSAWFKVALERMRQATEQAFPNARDFIRPGFDEVADELVN